MGKDAVGLGGNWNDGADAGSRCSNWGGAASASNDSLGVRFSCEDISLLFCIGYGYASRPFMIWSAILSYFGEYIVRFRIPLVSMRTGLLA